MSTTYLQAIGELQQRSIDSLKVAQDAQVSSLRAARDIATPAPTLIPAVRDVTGLALSIGCRIFALQAAYAKQVVDTLSGTLLPGQRETATSMPQCGVDVLPAASEISTPVERPPLRLAAARLFTDPPAIVAGAPAAMEPVVHTDAYAPRADPSPQDIDETALPSFSSAVAAAVIAESQNAILSAGQVLRFGASTEALAIAGKTSPVKRKTKIKQKPH